MSRIILPALFLLWLSYVSAQEPKFIQHNLGNVFKGIPINVMMQDSQGLIWLGTKNGLESYDGNELSIVTLVSPDSSIEVTSLFEDNEKRIWVGTATGYVYYLDRYRNVHDEVPEEDWPKKKITAIVQDKQDQIWFATYGEGVYVWTGTRLFNMNMDDCLSGNEIYAMTSLENGEVWLATDDGITICSFVDEKKQYRQLGISDGLPDQIITALKADHEGNVWIGTFENGAVQFNASQQKIVKPFNHQGMDEITSFEIFDNEEIWIGTRTSGVWRYNPQFEFVRKLVGLQTDKPFVVSDIIADVEGNIWIAMGNGELWSAFRQFESLVTNIGEILTVFSDHLDRLWVGTTKGLYMIQDFPTEISKPVRMAPSYDFRISGIVEDDFQNLWIATLDKGLFIYIPASGKIMEINSTTSKLGNTIMSMDRSKNDIWIATIQGTYAGVFSYPVNLDITKEKTYHFKILSDPWQNSLQYVNQVFVDSRDRVWFATDGNGVYSIDGKTYKHYAGNDSIHLNIIYSVSEDQKNHMWLNSLEWGLIELVDDTLKPLDISDGLTTMNNSSIIETKKGDILISHEHGIDLMEPGRRHFMYYATEIGADEFEPGTNSVTADSRRNIYIGGKNLIIKYYASNHKFAIDPKTLITRVQVELKPIDFENRNTFKHSENSFSFDFIGLWYTSPQSVNYEYKLSPVDSLPKESKDFSASYSNLPPGKYVFTVKASENKGFFNEPPAVYSFTINKPFWQEMWFYIPAIIGIGLMIYWLIKLRDKRIERQAMLKKEMIESQLQALKAQINPHFLFNSFNTLITIIDENALKPRVAIEYVEKLSDFFRSILQYREQETISLEEEWDMVQNFGYLLEKRYGSSLRLHLDPPLKDAYILPMTLQMLVENAVKHNVITEAKPLDVYITIDDDHYITVKNNLQPKAKAEPSTQFGLQSILRRYQMLEGRKVLIEKDHKNFIVRIPILKKSSE